jgi:hypothetical protein
MAKRVTESKTSPWQVAEQTMDGLRTGQDHVLADDSALGLWVALRIDPAAIETAMQTAWDHNESPWSA